MLKDPVGLSLRCLARGGEGLADRNEGFADDLTALGSTRDEFARERNRFGRPDDGSAPGRDVMWRTRGAGRRRQDPFDRPVNGTWRGTDSVACAQGALWRTRGRVGQIRNPHFPFVEALWNAKDAIR